jgi:Type IV secretion system pilin
MMYQLAFIKLSHFLAAVDQFQCDNEKTNAAGGFFGLPKWYRYMDYEASNITGRCEIVIDKANGLHDYWLIGFGILDMLLWLAGVVAVGYVVYGGFRYVTSQGEPDALNAARSTIINAAIGLVIAMFATAIVRFIGGQL